MPKPLVPWLPCFITYVWFWKSPWSVTPFDLFKQQRLLLQFLRQNNRVIPGVCLFWWILAVFHRAGFHTSIVMLWERHSRRTRICIQISKKSTPPLVLIAIDVFFLLGCVRFPEFVKNFSECQILSSLVSVNFHTFTLQLPIQTPHSVAPELQVFVSSLENCQNFSKTSTPLCE